MSHALPIVVEEVQQRLQKLQPEWLEVLDETYMHAGHAGTQGQDLGTHFRVRIASPQFNGIARVAQHRLVYDALADLHTRGLHALAIEVKPLPA